jgi:hypothetical protein
MHLNKVVVKGTLLALACACGIGYVYSSATASGVSISTQDSVNAGEAGKLELAVRRAIIKHWQIGLPDKLIGDAAGELSPNPRPGATPAVVSRPADRATTAEAAAGKKRTETTFAVDLAHASPALVAREENTLNNVVDALADPRQRLLGSGVFEITLTRTTISGADATVEGRLSAWSRFQVQQHDGRWVESTPVGKDHFTVKLKSVGAKWFVVDYVSSPLPGFSP